MRPFLLAVGLVVAGTALAATPPKAPWEEAIARPGVSILTLIKQGTCEGDQDGWSSTLVAAWLQANPEAVVVAAPFNRTAADVLVGKGFQPAAMAIAYRDGVQLDRVCGCLDAPAAATWLGHVTDGVTLADATAAKLGDTLDSGNITRWLDVVQMHYCANRLDQAFATAKGLWDRLPVEAPDLRPTRLTRVVHDMGVLASKSPAIKAELVTVRDDLDVAKNTDRASLDDWVALNRILMDDDRTLAWYDTVKDDAAMRELTEAQAPNLFYMLAERGKWVDAGNLMGDPIAWLDIWKQQAGGLETATWGYAALVAAGRTKEAGKLAKEIVKVAPEGAACRLIAKSTEVGGTHSSQKSLAKACEDATITDAWAASQ